MSLERNIQELHQAVTILTKSIDLQTATIAEATAEIVQAMQGRQTANMKVDAKAEVKKAEAAEQVKAATEAAPVELTDDEVKASPIYKMVQDKMSAHNAAALASNGNDAKAARADTLKILKSYSDDGKVLTFVRTLLEDEEAGKQVLTEMLGMYDKAIAEMQASDFEDGDEEQTYTADDVKQALRAYAKIEGRPAAIMKLQQLTNGKSEVKDIPEDQYAAVIAGLKADM